MIALLKNSLGHEIESHQNISALPNHLPSSPRTIDGKILSTRPEYDRQTPVSGGKQRWSDGPFVAPGKTLRHKQHCMWNDQKARGPTANIICYTYITVILP